MGLLTPKERKTLITLLRKLPDHDEPQLLRKTLLAAISDDMRDTISVDNAPGTNIVNIINGVDPPDWAEPPESGWPVLTLLDNALFYIRTEQLAVESELRHLQDTLKDRVMAQAQAKAPPRPASPASRRQFYSAILEAFTDPQELARTAYFRLQQNLTDIAPYDNQPAVVGALIEWAASRDKLYELIAAARADKPENTALRSLAEAIGLAPISPSQVAVERVIGDSSAARFLDIGRWNRGLSTSEPTVCRIERRSGGQTYYGTGFLVGPSLVMTTFHVVQDTPPGGPLEEIVCRFDYKTLPDGVTLYPGRTYDLINEWLLASSPIDKLDYALLRTEGRPGDDPIDDQLGASPRRWLTPAPSHTFRRGEPLFIIQHPQGGPRKVEIANNAVVGLDAAANRVLYLVETEPGSGGSPCFTADWELVAMHASSTRVTDAQGVARFMKAGIPLALILEDLKQKDLIDVLGT